MANQTEQERLGLSDEEVRFARMSRMPLEDYAAMKDVRTISDYTAHVERRRRAAERAELRDAVREVLDEEREEGR